MNRTGSMRSRVGPAVTSTLRPASTPASAGVAAGAAARIASTRSAGSSIRPGPVSPQAWSPTPGPRIVTPRDRSNATFACVAGFDHIRRFIAGAMLIGTSVARHSVASRSSARPCASRAMKSAVAGATRIRSAQRASSMWPIAASAASSQRSERTGRPDSAWNVSGVTNWRAPAVITTWTSAPRSRRRRTISALLYAAMPPETPSRIRTGVDDPMGALWGGPVRRGKGTFRSPAQRS